MTRAACLAALLVATAAGGARAAEPAGAIRDLRPTVLERGDVLVVECDAIAGNRTPVMLIVEGRDAAGAPRSIEIPGRVAAGNRVLADIDAALEQRLRGALRLHGVRARLYHHHGGGESRLYTTPPRETYTLEFFPASLRKLATAAADRVAGAPSSSPGAAAGAPASPGLHALLAAAVVLLVALGLHLLVAPLAGLVVVWERKISGRMQSRYGPNRVGPAGWLQWLADALKLIAKEDLVPRAADARLYRLAPYLTWMAVFATLVVLPLSQAALVADMNIGLLYLIAITSLTVIGVLMGGWAANSKWTLLGGMRAAAQIVSYEIPTALALLQVPLLAGTLAPQAIVRAQGGLPHEWFAFASPFSFAAFVIFFIAALAEGNRTPFDLPEAESEIVAGYQTEFSGFRFGIYPLAEWTNMIVVGAVAATAFLGGWNLPFVAADAVAASPALQVLSALLMTGKIAALVFVIIWLRWTLPRIRVDQMMALCWKVLVPGAFAAFLAAGALQLAVHRWPVVDRVSRWSTFAIFGVGLAIAFAVRVARALRATHLPYLGERQYTLPFIERPIDRSR